MNFFFGIKEAVRLFQLPKSLRRLTFYSEGRNYWPHLSGLIEDLLATSSTAICYISSDDKDPGLRYSHPNLYTFKTDEGFIRNWIFENIDTDIMVMTMPDLGQYQVNRSKHKVHYIYTQHSLVSLHMAYRFGAFDHFATIFCAGPHHIRETRLMETAYSLPAKTLVKHGYARLDTLITAAETLPDEPEEASRPLRVLLAPSWGPNCTVESGLGRKIIGQLLSCGFHVTFRPHPQTVKFSAGNIDEIVHTHSTNSLFRYEDSVAGYGSLLESDLMISDWSGAALEYGLGLNKPVLFVDTPPKVNNPRYMEIGTPPLESDIRLKLGAMIDLAVLDNLEQFRSLVESATMSAVPSDLVFNLGKSSQAGSSYIRSLLCSL